MSRHQIVHAAALCAAILVLLLGAVACAPRAVRVDQSDAQIPQLEPAENAVATVEPPPPPPPATQTCPDGSVITQSEACPPPPPPPPPAQSAERCCDPGDGGAQYAGRGESGAVKIDNDPF